MQLAALHALLAHRTQHKSASLSDAACRIQQVLARFLAFRFGRLEQIAERRAQLAGRFQQLVPGAVVVHEGGNQPNLLGDLRDALGDLRDGRSDGIVIDFVRLGSGHDLGRRSVHRGQMGRDRLLRGVERFFAPLHRARVSSQLRQLGLALEVFLGLVDGILAGRDVADEGTLGFREDRADAGLLQLF